MWKCPTYVYIDGSCTICGARALRLSRSRRARVVSCVPALFACGGSRLSTVVGAFGSHDLATTLARLGLTAMLPELAQLATCFSVATENETAALVADSYLGPMVAVDEARRAVVAGPGL